MQTSAETFALPLRLSFETSRIRDVRQNKNFPKPITHLSQPIQNCDSIFRMSLVNR